jgi:glutaredoxin
MELIVYSASWCAACKWFKESLQAEGIAYEERSLNEDEFAHEANKLGIKGLPAVRLPGTDLVLSTSSIDQVKEFLTRRASC